MRSSSHARRLAAPEPLEDRATPAADPVLEWNETLLDAIRTTATVPPRATRAMAIVHIAVFDAVNAIDREHEAYAADFDAPADASKVAAVAVAAHDTLTALFPWLKATFDAELAADLAAIPDGAAEDAGVAAGAQAAAAILALRASDGSNARSLPFMGGLDPGQWRPTPPRFIGAVLPLWLNVTPFSMTSGSQFRAPAPPALGGAEYAAAFDEVKDFGSATSVVRSADRTAIALFWADGEGTATPAGHWNSIAQTVSTQQGLTLEENARLFALLNIAVADAGISAWDMKYVYNFWRPITAIVDAGLDGNAATTADPAWTPLLATPPFPDYASGHSTFSSAAAAVLGGFFGTDAIAFTTGSDDPTAAPRSFASFSAAAAEAGESRIYGGINFRFDNAAGLAAGRQIGAQAVAERLLPVRRTPNEAYVRELYKRLLGRHAESSGLAAFVKRLEEGEARQNILDDFLASQEFRARQATLLYRDVLGREPDAAGLQGFVDAGANAEAILATMLASSEFLGTSGNGAADVEAVFQQVLGRSAEPSAVAGYAGRAVGDADVRRKYIDEVVYAPEALQLRVQAAYRLMLDRAADAAGLDAFADAIQDGMTLETVLREMAGSDEFFAKAR